MIYKTKPIIHQQYIFDSFWLIIIFPSLEFYCFFIWLKKMSPQQNCFSSFGQKRNLFTAQGLKKLANNVLLHKTVFNNSSPLQSPYFIWCLTISCYNQKYKKTISIGCGSNQKFSISCHFIFENQQISSWVCNTCHKWCSRPKKIILQNLKFCLSHELKTKWITLWLKCLRLARRAIVFKNIIK